MLLTTLLSFSLGAAVPLLLRLVNNTVKRVKHSHSVILPNEPVCGTLGASDIGEHLSTAKQH